MANKAAGEIEVVIDGTTYTLRPSFQCIMDFEEKSGTTVFEAMRNAGEKQSVPLKSLTAAMHAGIKAAWKPSMGQQPTFDQVGLAIRKDGAASHLTTYITFLANMMTGERALNEAQKEVEAGKA
jgi:hypothetical protein